MLDTDPIATELPVVEAPFARALDRLSDRDDVAVVTADLAKWTDVLGFARRHPDRFVQVGMAEQNLIGVTAGLAKSGWKPIAVTFGVFASRRAYDQIAMSLATRPCDAVIAGFLPGLDSRFRGSHQAIDDMALIGSIPGITVIDPGDATELEQAVVAAVDLPGVTYVRCSRGKVERLFDAGGHRFEVGPAELVIEGTGELGLITTGAATRWAWAARRRSNDPGSVSILHVPTVKPFPSDDVVAFAERHRRLFTIENHLVDGGLGSRAAGAVAAAGLGTPLERMGIPGTWGSYGTPEYSRSQLGLDAESLAERFSKVARTAEALP